MSELILDVLAVIGALAVVSVIAGFVFTLLADKEDY